MACYKSTKCSPDDNSMTVALPEALFKGGASIADACDTDCPPGANCDKFVKIEGVSLRVCDLVRPKRPGKSLAEILQCPAQFVRRGCLILADHGSATPITSVRHQTSRDR